MVQRRLQLPTECHRPAIRERRNDSNNDRDCYQCAQRYKQISQRRGPFLCGTKRLIVEWQSLSRWLSGGGAPLYRVQHIQHFPSPPTTDYSPSVKVTHPRLQSLVGRRAPRRSTPEAARDLNASMLVRQKECAWTPRLPGAKVRSWRRTFFPTTSQWVKRKVVGEA